MYMILSKLDKIEDMLSEQQHYRGGGGTNIENSSPMLELPREMLEYVIRSLDDCSGERE